MTRPTRSDSDVTTARSTPRAVDRHSRRRERTRARMMDAAKALFARQGIDNTRINEITEEADVGFGSFYNHFDSKEAIVEAVLEEAIAAQGSAIEAVTADLGDPAETVAVAHRYFVELARTDPDWAWLLIRLEIPHNLAFAALGLFAQRDLDRCQGGTSQRPRQAGRAVRGRRRASGRHARRARRTGAQERRPPPRRGRPATLRPRPRRRRRGGAATHAEDPPGPREGRRAVGARAFSTRASRRRSVFSSH
jgi:AcrR family transcriptional regulator